jgi:hypothetical protein
MILSQRSASLSKFVVPPSNFMKNPLEDIRAAFVDKLQ